MHRYPLPSRSLLLILVALTALGEISTQRIIPSVGVIELIMNTRHGSILLALAACVAAFGLGQLLLGLSLPQVLITLGGGMLLPARWLAQPPAAYC